jgi:cob(I)alamin adenosyltransferase
MTIKHMHPGLNNGLFIIYTGNGKGKTTAGLGLALRTMGHKERVCIIQFIKSRDKCGEHRIKEILGDLYTIHVMGRGFIFKGFHELSKEEQEKNKAAAEEGWDLAREAISSGEYRLIILDELTYLFRLNLLTTEEVLPVIQNRPAGVHVLMTGRDAPESLMEQADIVTEMKEIKHGFHKGIKAQKCIEW